MGACTTCHLHLRRGCRGQGPSLGCNGVWPVVPACSDPTPVVTMQTRKKWARKAAEGFSGEGLRGVSCRPCHRWVPLLAEPLICLKMMSLTRRLVSGWVAAKPTPRPPVIAWHTRHQATLDPSFLGAMEGTVSPTDRRRPRDSALRMPSPLRTWRTRTWLYGS